MKKEWQKPTLEILDINLTAAGPGKRYVDQVFEDEDEQGKLHRS